MDTDVTHVSARHESGATEEFFCGISPTDPTVSELITTILLDKYANIPPHEWVVEVSALHSTEQTSDAGIDSFTSPTAKRQCQRVQTPKMDNLSNLVHRMDSLSPFKAKKNLGKVFASDATDSNDNVVLKTLLPTVLITDMSEVDIVQFTEYLNSAAVQYNILHPGNNAVVSVQPGLEEHSYEVEFINESIARLMCSIDYLCYEDRRLYMSQQVDARLATKSDKHAPIRTPTAVVTVHNLPRSLFEAHFKNFLNQKAWEDGLVDTNMEAVKSVMDYDKSKQTCSVEFVTPTMAQQFCQMPPLSYDRKTLELSQVSDDSSCAESCSLTSSVKVENLPSFFFEPHFIHFLNQVAWDKKFAAEGEKAVLGIEQHDETSRSCIVKFLNADIATKVVAIQPHIYDRLELSMRQVSAEAASALAQSGAVLVVSKLPSVFFEEHFINFINETASLFNLCDDGDEVVKRLSLDKARNSCVIEFYDADVAVAMRRIRPLMYDKQIIEMDEAADVAVVMPKTNTPLPPRFDWPGYETCVFLKLCCSQRDQLLCRNPRMVGGAWKAIEKGMQDAGLNYGISNMKSRLKGIRGWAAKAGPQYDYLSLVKELEGTAPPGSGIIPEKFKTPCIQIRSTSTKDGESAKPEAAKAQPKKRMHGIVVIDGTVIDESEQQKFNKDLDIPLAKAYKRHKGKFDDDKTHAIRVWKLIQEELNVPHIPPATLCNRMAKLAMDFRARYDRIMNCTGDSADALRWAPYDAVSQCFEGSYTLQAAKTAAMGVDNVTMVRQPGSSTRYVLDEGDLPGKKSSEKKKSPSLKERRVQAMESIAAVLARKDHKQL